MFNVVVCCVVRFFFLFRNVDVEDSGFLGCYTDCYIGSRRFEGTLEDKGTAVLGNVAKH